MTDTVINWIRRFVYDQHVSAKRLILDAGEAPAFRSWLASIAGDFGPSKIAPVGVSRLEDAINLTAHPLATVADGRARYANEGYAGVFHPDHLPGVADVKAALKPSLVPAYAPTALYEEVLKGANIPTRFFNFIATRGVCVLAGQNARALARFLPTGGTITYTDLFGNYGAPRTGLLSSFLSRDPSTRQYVGKMLATRAEFVNVEHVTPNELATAFTTIHAMHKQLRHSVGVVIGLDGHVPPGADYGFDFITDKDFENEAQQPKMVAASSRSGVPPEIQRAGKWINTPVFHEVRVSTLEHMREQQRRSSIGMYT